MRVVIVGRGRAGGAFAAALAEVGNEVETVPGERDPIDGVGVDVVLLCVPDDAIARVASRVRPDGAVVAHCAGSRTLEVLGPHPRVGSVHPLMSLPDAARGAERLLDSCVFAVAGDPLVHDLVRSLGGRSIEVADDDRAAYHAAACVAANHLVVLCAQVERIAADIGVPVDGYWTMMGSVLGNVAESGAAASLTGPAARGDAATIAAHLAALPEPEHDLYRTLADAARALAAGDV